VGTRRLPTLLRSQQPQRGIETMRVAPCAPSGPRLVTVAATITITIESGREFMRYIDAFNHFFPKGLWDNMLASGGTARDIGKRMRGIRRSTIWTRA
jgi:hypothetical protein